MIPTLIFKQALSQAWNLPRRQAGWPASCTNLFSLPCQCWDDKHIATTPSFLHGFWGLDPDLCAYRVRALLLNSPPSLHRLFLNLWSYVFSPSWDKGVLMWDESWVFRSSQYKMVNFFLRRSEKGVSIERSIILIDWPEACLHGIVLRVKWYRMF